MPMDLMDCQILLMMKYVMMVTVLIQTHVQMHVNVLCVEMVFSLMRHDGHEQTDCGQNTLRCVILLLLEGQIVQIPVSLREESMQDVIIHFLLLLRMMRLHLLNYKIYLDRYVIQ
jgi:hypothetical protein